MADFMYLIFRGYTLADFMYRVFGGYDVPFCTFGGMQLLKCNSQLHHT